MLLTPAVALLVAFALTAALLPVVARRVRVRRLLHRSGDDLRRDGAPLIPRIGGVAVVVGTVGGVVAALLLRTAGAPASADWLHPAPQLIVSAALVFLLGLVDDLRGVKPYGKLAVQLVAAGIAWQAGVRIEAVVFPPDITLSTGPFAFPLTILWLVGISNAINLVDGLDGLAALETVIALCCVIGAALALHNNGVVLLALAMLGATLAFLRANWHPAWIFLGDSGSLVIGFVLAIATVESARRSNGAVVILVPFLALAYPILDTSIAILRRWLRAEPLSRADGRHVHHQLVALGYTQPQAVRALGLFSASMACLALAVAFARPAVSIVVALLVLGALAGLVAWGLRWLQYDEFAEAGAAVLSVARRGRDRLRFSILAREVERQLAGAATVEALDAMLRDAAPGLGVADIRICRESARRRLALVEGAEHAFLYRVDVPVLDLRDAEPSDPVVLRVYGVAPQTYAERAAHMLAPAIRQYLATWPREHVASYLPYQRSDRARPSTGATAPTVPTAPTALA